MNAPPVERALLLLSGANPDRNPGELSKLCIGDRDALLLEMLERFSGAYIEARASCPGCKTELELSLRPQDLKAQGPDLAKNTGILRIKEYEVEFRLPNSLDLDAISRCKDLDSSRSMLIQRCVSRASKQEASCRVEDLPSFILEALSVRMGEMDPQANILINLICPSCQWKWSSSFDVAPFLWSQVDALAKRTFMEVHHLAACYGWSEGDILAMSQRRRQAYIDMIRQ